MTRRGLNKVSWFCRALTTLVLVRFGLTFLSYRRMTSWWAPSRGLPDAPLPEQARCAWAVTRAAAFVPGASCLTQALAGRSLLAGRGFNSRVVVGVRRHAAAGVAAHAWLRVGDGVVLGDVTENLDDFTELLELGVSA